MEAARPASLIDPPHERGESADNEVVPRAASPIREFHQMQLDPRSGFGP